jgi:hypothetical protein
MKPITFVLAAATLAIACAAVAVAAPTPTTIKSVSGVDNGDGTASYSGKIKAAGDCREKRKVKLSSTPPPEPLGSDKTNGKGKWAFKGPIPGDLQRIAVQVAKRGNECAAATAILRYDEVFD